MIVPIVLMQECSGVGYTSAHTFDSHKVYRGTLQSRNARPKASDALGASFSRCRGGIWRIEPLPTIHSTGLRTSTEYAPLFLVKELRLILCRLTRCKS